MNYSSAMLSSLQALAAQQQQAAAAAAAANGSGGGIKRTEVQGLPKGWIREEVPPRFDPAAFFNGLGAGNVVPPTKPEVVYYSPKGQMANRGWGPFLGPESFTLGDRIG